MGRNKIEIIVSSDNSDIIVESLLPEVSSSPSNRSKVDINKKNGNLEVFVEAKDISSLRAAMNSWLRWIMIADEAASIPKDF